MSGVAAAAVGYGSYGVLIADSNATRQRLNTLTQQAGSGLVADTYAGLGAQGAATSLSLSPVIASADALHNGIGAAASQMQVAQSALANLSRIANTFYTQTNSLNGLNASTVDSVAASARSALAEVAGLLDSKSGDIYVFAGQDSGNPPVPDPDQIANSGFTTQITAAVAALGSNGASATIAATLATAQSNATGVSPFSAALSQPAAVLATLRSSVSVGGGQSVATGILASGNGDVASTGSSTTGSYTRDILRALATLAGLSSSQIGATGFADVVGDVRTSLGASITALNQDAGVMGDRQAALATTQTEIGDTATALKLQVSNAQDVDMAATLSQITATQTQLQASYQLIAGMQSLSLVKYL